MADKGEHPAQTSPSNMKRRCSCSTVRLGDSFCGKCGEPAEKGSSASPVKHEHGHEQEGIADYFLVVGMDPKTPERIERDDQFYTGRRASMHGGSISQEVPPSPVPLPVAFRPTLLDQFPPPSKTDDPKCPVLPPMASVVCLPDGVVLHKEDSSPLFYTFVLTNIDGSKVYGANLVFFERVDPEVLKKMQLEVDMDLVGVQGGPSRSRSLWEGTAVFKSPHDVGYLPKAICVLSRWPFFAGFRSFLTCLYRLSLSSTKVPLERYIGNFIQEIPLPPPGRISVNAVVGTERIEFSRPGPNDLPMAEFNLKTLFQMLSLQNIISLFYLVATEQRVLVHSHYLSALTPTLETIKALLFPLQWCHVYVPLLAQAMFNMLDAPVPYLFGVCSAHLVGCDIPVGVYVVDLDENRITLDGADTKINFADRGELLRPLLKLKYVFDSRSNVKLSELDHAYPSAPLAEAVENNNDSVRWNDRMVRVIFLEYMLRLLKDYRTCLKVRRGSDVSLTQLFDVERFLKKQPKSRRGFVQELVETQAFTLFVEQQADGAASQEREAELVFFDNYLDATSSELAALASDDSYGQIVRTHEVPEPNTNELPRTDFKYPHGFPKLSRRLFSLPRTVKSLDFNTAPLRKNRPVSMRTPARQSGRSRLSSSLKMLVNQAISGGRRDTTSGLAASSDHYMVVNMLKYVFKTWFIVCGATIPTMDLPKASVKEAILVLEWMSGRGVEPDEDCFRPLLAACLAEGLGAEARQLYNVMLGRGIMPTARTYGCFVRALAMEGEHDVVASPGKGEIGDESENVLSDNLADAPVEIKREVSDTDADGKPYKACVLEVSGDQCEGCGSENEFEDIMCYWNPEGENPYHTQCASCRKSFLPAIKVGVFMDKAARSASQSNIRLKPSRIGNFLSPRVLYEEVEMLWRHGGDSSLQSTTLRQLNPVLFWNMSWYFHNLGMPLDILRLKDLHRINLVILQHGSLPATSLSSYVWNDLLGTSPSQPDENSARKNKMIIDEIKKEVLSHNIRRATKLYLTARQHSGSEDGFQQFSRGMYAEIWSVAKQIYAEEMDFATAYRDATHFLPPNLKEALAPGDAAPSLSSLLVKSMFTSSSAQMRSAHGVDGVCILATHPPRIRPKEEKKLARKISLGLSGGTEKMSLLNKY